MRKHRGFTLIEILIALTIFAILATLTSSSLYYAFNTRTQVNLQADRLNQLQLAVSLLQQDLSQIIDRAVRGNEMRLFPAIIGQNQYLEFTRDGMANPQSQNKRSHLKRVALVCLEGNLIRRTWLVLDPINRNNYEDKILIDNLNACAFNYLNQNLQPLPDWHQSGEFFGAAQPVDIFPKAIQIKLNLKNWGKMDLLFIIPGMLYEST